MNFNDLSLQSPALLANIERLGFSSPTQIQAEVIPLALQGRDVSGLSRTGTGKTCAFLIPTIDRLLQCPPDTFALCLAPTRELAIQIEAEAQKLCQDLPLSAVCVVGGMPIQEQIRAMRDGARLIIGTPGRVLELIRNRDLNPATIEILIFDEADRMFDMGFIDDMRFIMEKVNSKRQILLFSATMNFTVLNMMYEFNSDPVEVNVSKDQITADGIEQVVYHVGESEKPAYLIKFCSEVVEGGIIVFVNYRESVYWVSELLRVNGVPATGISSLLRQDKRNKILSGFRNGKFRALVATDVASRGLDINGVALVVNYHLPEESANYVHRIGRTARAGKSGIAISVAGPNDGYNQIRIEEFIGNKIPIGWLASDQINFDIKFPGRNLQESEDMNNDNPSQKENNRPRNNRFSNSSRGGDRDHRSRRHDRGGRSNSHYRGQGPRSQATRSHASRPHAPNGDTTASPEKRILPPPITGNPMIYCTVTGKQKTNAVNTPSEMNDNEKRVNILQKIGSTVSSIFSKK